MSWYKEHGNEWKEIISTVAAEKHKTTQMVEKDTIQSIVLFELSKSGIPFVFKGGTSLSKCYGLIDRFSEDLDLSMSIRPTEAEKKKIKAVIIDSADRIGLRLINPDAVLSRHSYNKYVFEYESLFSKEPLEIIIETSFFLTVYPVQLHEVRSFVGSFCKEYHTKNPVSFDAATLIMQVQSLERTFIDKVFAVCDYRIQDMQDRDSRHLYDIAKLLQRVKLDADTKTLIKQVREDRIKLKENLSARPEYNIKKILKEIIGSRFYEADYNNVTRKLLYEDMSYDEAIASGIGKVVDTDLFD